MTNYMTLPLRKNNVLPYRNFFSCNFNLSGLINPPNYNQVFASTIASIERNF